MLNRLTDSLNFQTQALTLRAERQRVIAGNIANADTPGYKAREFSFSQALRTAVGEGSALAASTHARHVVPGVGPSGLPTAQAYALQAQTNLDSNTVDMDRERAAFVDNALKYEATLRFVNSSVRTQLDAMRSHNAAV